MDRTDVKHKHHLFPKYAGVDAVTQAIVDDPDNIVVCSLEGHAQFHKAMWLFHGNREDYIAWKFLSGQMNQAEVSAEQRALNLQKLRAAVNTPEYRTRNQAARNTVEYRGKLSVALKGHPTSTETRVRISATLKGRVTPPEVRARIGASLQGKKLLKPRTSEYRAKQRASQLWSCSVRRAALGVM